MTEPTICTEPQLGVSYTQLLADNDALRKQAQADAARIEGLLHRLNVAQAMAMQLSVFQAEFHRENCAAHNGDDCYEECTEAREILKAWKETT